MEKQQPDEKKEITVGMKEGLGMGVIAIGLLLFFLPGTAQKIADIIQNSTAYGILTGAVYVMALFAVLAGLAIILTKFDEED
jgi:hypothetical protein